MAKKKTTARNRPDLTTRNLKKTRRDISDLRASVTTAARTDLRFITLLINFGQRLDAIEKRVQRLERAGK